jgi:multiple sugar transport system permease protein/raffinose/stachyose/melibiose transport system permease protein
VSAIGLHARRGERRWRSVVSRALIYFVLALTTVVMLYPFYYMGLNAFRSLDQYYAGHGFSFASWRNLFKALPVGRELLNSTIITLGAIAVILAVSTTAGYAFAVLRYRASRFVFLVVIAAMMVPMQSIIAPEFVNLANIGFINHRYGAILVYAALGAPFSTFLMTTYFRRIPEDVIEAALIDGLGYGGVFFLIMLPLALPAIFTIAVLQFIQVWDDLLVGLLFLQTPDVRPITVGLATIPSQHLLDVPLLMAGSLISALPAVIVYLVFQRYLVTGLTMGISK